MNGIPPSHYELTAAELRAWADLWERAAKRCLAHALRWAERSMAYRELAEARRA